MADVLLCCNCIKKPNGGFEIKSKPLLLFGKKEIAGGMISVPYFAPAALGMEVFQVYKAVFYCPGGAATLL
jgi:hypothetical protein